MTDDRREFDTFEEALEHEFNLLILNGRYYIEDSGIYGITSAKGLRNFIAANREFVNKYLL